MTDIEQYFNDADHTIVFGELKDDEETIRSGVRGKSRMVIALLLKLTSNALKESKYDVNTYCKLLKEVYSQDI
ncbi:MAG: hypothetical protein IKS59_06755 [Aeriscardovia sp.]|nr:hypothetical protein [Aeriscardovia sp.]